MRVRLGIRVGLRRGALSGILIGIRGIRRSRIIRRIRGFERGYFLLLRIWVGSYTLLHGEFLVAAALLTTLLSIYFICT